MDPTLLSAGVVRSFGTNVARPVTVILLTGLPVLVLVALFVVVALAAIVLGNTTLVVMASVRELIGDLLSYAKKAMS
ncbi:hypothetical protein AB0G02_24095 [Actinosynnema sp. NPDC023658]|uniref:hypothetical protein n=1 Tax=Actinosynnema sp. NPDC023658 TaxID=3155465 RepID=UPI00340E664B